jgi:hypothetical protein
MPLSQLTDNLNKALHAISSREKQVSESTVRRTLHNNGLIGRAAAKKLSLSSLSKKARVSWCKEMSQEEDDYWHRVVFSDETRIGLHSDGRVWVWRRKGERYDPNCTIVRSTDRKSIMYWGCITYDGFGRLIRCSNHMNADEYCNILQEGCVQLITAECNMLFMQDNAPVHRAQIVKNWMTENSVSCISWPAYSPDLNPIEEVWSLMKRKLNGRCLVKSLDQLDEQVQQIWSEFSVSYVRNLYNSIQNRLRECIKQKGHPINY